MARQDSAPPGASEAARDVAPPDVASLDAALLDAHDADDRGAPVALYSAAAAAQKDRDAAAFFLTHAYIFALETGSDQAHVLLDELVALGRETRASA